MGSKVKDMFCFAIKKLTAAVYWAEVVGIVNESLPPPPHGRGVELENQESIVREGVDLERYPRFCY